MKQRLGLDQERSLGLSALRRTSLRLERERERYRDERFGALYGRQLWGYFPWQMVRGLCSGVGLDTSNTGKTLARVDAAKWGEIAAS